MPCGGSVHTGIGRDARTDLFQDRRAYVWDNNSDTAVLGDDRGRKRWLTGSGRLRPAAARAGSLSGLR